MTTPRAPQWMYSEVSGLAKSAESYRLRGFSDTADKLLRDRKALDAKRSELEERRAVREATKDPWDR